MRMNQFDWHRVPAVVLLAATALLTRAVTGEPVVNPYPRAIVNDKVVARWTFTDGVGRVEALNQCRITAEGGALVIESTGEDPYLLLPPMYVTGKIAVTLRMRSTSGGAGRVYWSTSSERGFAEERAAGFAMRHDDQWHDYTVSLPNEVRYRQLRLDPGQGPGVIRIEWIEVRRQVHHPLEIAAVSAQKDRLAVTLRNHDAAARPVRVNGQATEAPANGQADVVLPVPVDRPFAATAIEVASDGLPAITRHVVLHHPDAEGRWVTLRDGDLTVQVSESGDGARVMRGDRLAAVIAPLAGRPDGEPIALRIAAQSPRHVELVGEGVERLTIALRDGLIEWRLVAGESQGVVEGPVVRAVGSLEQGLLAGVEYLGKGERSSSTLDIRTPEHLRFAPDPMHLTMPLAAAVTDAGSAALLWSDPQLQPTFASPNFVDGAADHRMSLRGRRIDAVIRIGDSWAKGERLESAIAWAVKHRGLPPLPDRPRDDAAQRALSLAALNGPLCNENGWGHCAEPRWARHFYSDHASTVWRLTGEVPTLPDIVPGGAHIDNHAIFFVTGRAPKWLDWQNSRATHVRSAQRSDGSFRYDGPFREGHFENTASGIVGHNAVILLEHVRFTGDEQSKAAGLAAVAYARRFRTPRGAQTWEVPLHTPDILASAHLTRANVLAFELTGQGAYLDEARRWAVTGVPFVYQWGATGKPIMRYATTPVLGATNWVAPNWIGLPVQWCGLVYAESLLLLAKHDRALDWRMIAEGITIAGEQMQYPDGPHIGCLPDGFNLSNQQRLPADINPCALASLRMRLNGQLDGLSVAATPARRVVAPFPVTVHGDKARIEASAGVRYQIVVDGRNVLDVTSRGVDEIDLPGQ